MWFQQDGATCYCGSNNAVNADEVLWVLDWPPRSCDLILLDFFLGFSERESICK